MVALLSLSCGPGSAVFDESSATTGTQPASLTADPVVRLAYAFGARCPPTSGCTLAEQLDGVVEVKNLAFAKQVEVVFKDANQQWRSAPATYLAPASDGYEAWAFHVGPSSEFALSATINGEKFWDSNAGANYHLQRGTDALVKGKVVAGINGTVRPGLATGWVFVENRAFEKRVGVVYTDDGWVTHQTAPASYALTFPSGVEAWRFEAPLRPNAAEGALQFATQYDVGALQGWDNNYRRNYRVRVGTLVR